MPDLAAATNMTRPTVREGEFSEFYALPEIRGWAKQFQTRRFAALALVLLLPAAGAAGVFAFVRGLLPAAWTGPEWWTEPGVVVFFVAGVLLLAFALSLLWSRKAALKLPVLATLARHRGLSYVGKGFENPIGEEYTLLLVGHWPLSIQSYADFFHGYSPDGAGLTFFDAELMRGHGKGAHIAFKGTIHAYGRAGPEAQTVIWSHGGLVNYLRPNGPLPKVRIEGDPEFDRMFEVRASDPAEAVRLLTHTALGCFLLERRSKGRIDAYIGPHMAILGLGGRDRFEVGALIGWRGAEARARRMYDEVVESQELLRRFRELVG